MQHDVILDEAFLASVTPPDRVPPIVHTIAGALDVLIGGLLRWFAIAALVVATVFAASGGHGIDAAEAFGAGLVAALLRFGLGLLARPGRTNMYGSSPY